MREVTHLLDTDTCSYAIRGVSTVLDLRLERAEPGSLSISAVTRAELMYGLYKRGNPRALSLLVRGFLDRVAAMPWDALAADRYAQVQVQLERAGTPIGVLDAMIASHALALKAVVVTNNVRHFSAVRGLKVENWVG